MSGIGIAFLVGFLVVCNVVLDLALVLTFKKRVSTKKDEVIGIARQEMDLIIADMNRQTDRNITLFKDYMRELKAAVAEADRHATVARNEIEKLNQLQAQLFAQRMQLSSHTRQRQKSRSVEASRAAERYQRTAAGMSPYALPVTAEGQQGDLFNDTPPEPNEFTVTQDGTSYASLPVLGLNVTFADEPVRPQQDFGSLVRERYDRGETVEEIAVALDRSTTEIQLALDMGA